MKRFKYGLNFAVNNYGRFYEALPVSVVETAPGDTLAGTVTARVITDTTTRVIQNRTYHDMYTFYVPYRLLWDEWPDFIAQVNDALVPPSDVSTAQQLLLRNQDAGKNNDFIVRAYNLIWNKFFKNTEVPENSPTNITPSLTALRPTTINQRLRTAVELLDQTVDTSGATLTVGAIRDAFAKDRYDKLRAYYGSKYTDYLNAIGVAGSWSILEEPELVGMKMANLNWTTVDATANVFPVDAQDPSTVLGQVAGRWNGSNTVRVKKTFTPEHGLLITLAVIRMDAQSIHERYPLFAQKTQYDDFYQPQFETVRKTPWEPLRGAPGLDNAVAYTEQYDDYRVGQNISVVRGAGGQNQGTYYVRPQTDVPASEDEIPAWLDYVDPDQLDFFAEVYGPGIQHSTTAISRLTRISSVRPSQSAHGVA